MSDTEPVIESSEPIGEPVETVDVGEVTVGEPAVTEAAEPVVAEAPAAPAVEDPFASYGGKDVVEAAYRMHQAASTEDGVIQLFLEAGRNLGLGLDQMQRLFTDLAGEAPEPPDPDEPLTRGEFEAMQRKQQEALANAQAQQVQAAARQVVQATVAELGLDPADPSTKIVLQFGDEHVKGDFSPENVAKAIRAGHADYQALVEKESSAYLERKRQQAQSVPSAPAGAAAPATSPDAEPTNVAEAIKQARKKWYSAAT